MIKLKRLQPGFTFLESILYIAIVSIFIGAVVMMAWNIIYGNVKSESQKEVIDNLRLASKRISFEIRGATNVTINSPTSISIATTDASRNPTVIDLNSGRIRLGFGSTGTCTSAAPCYLTSSKTNITSLAFTDLSNAGSASQVIRFAINMSYRNPTNKKEWDFSDTFTTSVETRGKE